MKKNTHGANVDIVSNTDELKRVYPVSHAKINPKETIHKQAINDVMLYRNHDGCVIHAEATS